jgi:cold shock CspA family protein
MFFIKSNLAGGHIDKGTTVTFEVAMAKDRHEAIAVRPLNENGAAEQLYSGTIKSYVPAKGWGMIQCDETFAEFGKDMFVLKSSLPDGHAEKGDRVLFSVKQGSNGPEATSIIFGKRRSIRNGVAVPMVNPGKHAQAGPLVPMVRPGNAYAGKHMMFVPESALQSHHAGVVKSFNETSGWGFITPSSHEFGKDMFVMKTALKQGTSLNPGDEVHFKVVTGLRGLEAQDVYVVPKTQELDGQTFTGMIKSYNATKSWGFIESQAAMQMFGRDIFFHQRDLGDHTPETGEQVEFSVGRNDKGHPQAKNLIFSSGAYRPTPIGARRAVAKATLKPY